MKVRSVSEMRDWEEAMKERGLDEASLMEQAGKGIAEALRKHFPQPGLLVVYMGKGHNAGDALVAARDLQRWGWKVEIRAFYAEIEWAVLTRQHYRLFAMEAKVAEPSSEVVVVMDGLLGIGARGMLRDPLRKAVVEMREMRLRGAVVVALDVPTGLDADTGVQDELVVEADMTFAIGAPKLGLLDEKAVDVVGKIELIPIGVNEGGEGEENGRLIVPGAFGTVLEQRPHDFHKGQAGRLSIVAGSMGMEGAAVLCANAAMRTGVGMVTLWVPERAWLGVMTRVYPEVMVRSYRSLREIQWEKADAFVLGPGSGEGLAEEFMQFIDLVLRDELPGVFDADALNAVANQDGHHLFRRHHILTPHAGEFARLAPEFAAMSREEMCRNFTASHDAVLLLKGARTLVHQQGMPMHFNSTGHAGMATAGMGDVLAGVIGGLLAQRVEPFEAACVGAWLAGRAAELAVPFGVVSRRSLVASDLWQQLGFALAEWERA